MSVPSPLLKSSNFYANASFAGSIPYNALIVLARRGEHRIGRLRVLRGNARDAIFSSACRGISANFRCRLRRLLGHLRGGGR